MRLAVVALALSAVSAAPQPPVRFVMPRARVAVVGPGGTDLYVQVRVERHPDNRWFTLAWGGEGCAGSWGKSMDGEDEAALQPIQPMTVRVRAGACTFVAAVFGPDAKERARATLEFRACGGEESCQ